MPSHRRNYHECMAVRVAALLAAGAGTRFVKGGSASETHKLLATIDGQPIWQRSLSAMMAAQFAKTFVVTGAVQLDLPPGAIELHNPSWSRGQASSLHCAVIAAAAAEAESLTIGLADQPAITTAAWRAVANAAARHRIVIATYGGAPGPHPVRLLHNTWDLLSPNGDRGARDLINAHPDWVHEVECSGSAIDVDTRADLDRLQEMVRVTELLGRPPQGEFDVVVRDVDGEPIVLRNAPLMHDGRPMPTMYWLAGKAAIKAISRLEAAGGVRIAESELDPAQVAAAHARYAAERDILLPANHKGPRPTGGVGGTRRGIKCLHAHYAYHLAGGDDPVGRWAAAKIGAVPAIADHERRTQC